MDTEKIIKLSKHAERQIIERNLNLKEVKETVINPDQVIDSKKGRKIAQKIYKKEGKEFLLRVIYVKEGDNMKIITVYRTSKIDKYWRKTE